MAGQLSAVSYPSSGVGDDKIRQGIPAPTNPLFVDHPATGQTKQQSRAFALVPAQEIGLPFLLLTTPTVCTLPWPVRLSIASL